MGFAEAPSPLRFLRRFVTFQGLAARKISAPPAGRRRGNGESSLRRQPEYGTVSRAPLYRILWVRGFRDHTISGRGSNLFKALRRHFRTTPFGPVAPRSRRPKRLGSKDRRSARRSPPYGGDGTNIERLRNSGKKFVGRLGLSKYFVLRGATTAVAATPEMWVSTATINETVTRFPSWRKKIHT